LVSKDDKDNLVCDSSTPSYDLTLEYIPWKIHNKYYSTMVNFTFINWQQNNILSKETNVWIYYAGHVKVRGKNTIAMILHINFGTTDYEFITLF
jgi:hypothetical protein